jgi:leucyl-tRNA synthetase
LQQVYRLVLRHAGRMRGVKHVAAEARTEKEKALLRKAHQTLKRVTHDYESRWHFNTSVSAMMKLANELQAQEPLEQGADPAVVKGVFDLLVQMLAPMAPHLGEELWEMLGHEQMLVRSPWPAYREELAREEQFEVVIQINGKVRGRILVEDGLSEDEVRRRAVEAPGVAPHLNGRHVIKTVVVPNKLVNLVVQ